MKCHAAEAYYYRENSKNVYYTITPAQIASKELDSAREIFCDFATRSNILECFLFLIFLNMCLVWFRQKNALFPFCEDSMP